jgi:AcrR family transcriptional regulator
MGMSGPALYRYFANRDELITDLVTDAYGQLAAAFRAAVDEHGPDPAALAHAMRGWALAHPQRYFLIYGTPIPGYHAPPSTTAIAAELMTMLLDALRDHPPGTATAFDAHLDEHRAWTDDPAPAGTLHRALGLWARLHGVISLEIAGHFTDMGFDTTLFFEAELDAMLGR